MSDPRRSQLASLSKLHRLCKPGAGRCRHSDACEEPPARLECLAECRDRQEEAAEVVEVVSRINSRCDVECCALGKTTVLGGAAVTVNMEFCGMTALVVNARPR